MDIWLYMRISAPISPAAVTDCYIIVQYGMIRAVLSCQT